MADSKAVMRIGEWAFDPATCELKRGGDVRRIEPRAALALELLHAAEGGVVSQEQFVERIWDGRALSPNSVPVVIGQLRRALEDDAREPQILETIPKRGYRLRAAEPTVAEAAPPRDDRWTAALMLLFLLVGGGWMLTASRVHQAPTLAIANVVNATGNPAYDPLARATSELIVDRFDRQGFRLRRDGPADLKLQAKLVMWDGHPSLGLTALDRDSVVRWSAMMDASPGKVPPGVGSAVADFAGKFSPSGGGQRVAKAEGDR